MKNYKTIFWLFTFVVFFQSLLPINNADSELNNNYLFSFRLDHLVHFLLFIAWTVFFKLAWYNQKNLSGANIFLMLALGVLFAVAAECIQLLIPYRAFSINDLASNMAGVLVCITVMLFFNIKRRNRFISA